MGILTNTARWVEDFFGSDNTGKDLPRPPGSVATAPTLDMKMAGMNMANIIPAMYESWGAYGYMPSMSWYQIANMYVSWTYAASNKKATTLASLPVQLFRYEKKGTGKTVDPVSLKYLLRGKSFDHSEEQKVLNQVGVKKVSIDEHPALSLLNDPNPDMVRSNFWQLMCIHLFLNGGVGIYKAKQFLGNPTELHILPTTWTGNFKPIPGGGKDAISGYKLIDLDRQVDFTPDEAFWPHFPSLRNPFECMSPLKANLYGFNLDQYMLQQMSAFYKNGAMFSNVLSTDQVLSQDVYDDIKQQVQNYQGAKNAGQMFVAHGGMEFKNPVTQTARESMVTEIERMVREKILAGEDVSEGKLGLTSQQNKANLEVVNENYFNEAIRPAAILLTEYFDKFLVRNYDPRLSFEFIYPSFEDRAAKLEERKAYLDRGKNTINEFREQDGEAPVPWGDVPLITSSMMPLGERPEPVAPITEKPTVEGDDEDGKAFSGIKNKAFWTPEKKALAWKRFDRLARGYEPLFVRAAMKHFKEVQSSIIDNLESQGVKVKTELASRSRQHKLEYMAEHKDRLDSFVPDKLTLKTSLKKQFKDIYEQTLKGSADNRADQLGIELSFNVNDPRVEQWLGTRLETFSENVSQATIKKTKEILREAFANGDGLVNMADQLKDYFTGNEERAHTIARTESVAAYNRGDIEAVNQLGINLKKVWLAEPTARPTHAEAGDRYSEDGDPGPIDIDEIFEVGSDRMVAPGNGSEAGENVNCRCSLVYVRGD
jgi:HK97 family phage portal protein